MMAEIQGFFRLLLGTVIYRPYVYGFFACFIFFALRHLGRRNTALFMGVSYLTAYASEFSATRNGFPFGTYTYLDQTRTRELWLSNIPFWDSLSFIFLSYFSWVVAASLLDPEEPSRALALKRTALLGGGLMMLLDVVIDPLTLLGDRWFLGKIYYYPQGGSYFGVTLSNFLGWFFVGSLTLFIYQKIHHQGSSTPIDRRQTWGSFGVYAGVFCFNLGITGWIGEWRLFAVSALVILLTLGVALFRLRPVFSLSS